MHTSRGDRLLNWPFSQLLDLRDLDLGSGYMTYRRVSLINLYVHTKFHSNQNNFLWKGGRRTRPNKNLIFKINAIFLSGHGLQGSNYDDNKWIHTVMKSSLP